MKYLYLTPLLFLGACAARDVILTAQYIDVQLSGSDAAYCVLSTRDNRYSLMAPGKAYIERDDDDLKIDCNDNASDRRRTVVVGSEFGLGYWTYPSEVKVDFATAPTADNGFRLLPTEGATKEILTEKSYSRPVDPAPQLGYQTYETNYNQEILVQESPIDLTTNQDAVELMAIEQQSLEALSETNQSTITPIYEQPPVYVQPTEQKIYYGRKSYPID